MRCTPISLKITYALMHGGQMQSHSKTGVLSDYYLTFITKDDFIPVCINSLVKITSAPGLLYCSLMVSVIMKSLLIVCFEKVRFLPLLNKSVISSKAFVRCRLAVWESSLISLTPNSFGRPDRGKFSLLPRREYRRKKLYTILCFRPDILKLSIVFIFASKRAD